MMQKCNELSGLVDQAQSLKENSFAFCREGNEVLVDCRESGKAQLFEKIRKKSDNSPVIDELVQSIRTEDIQRVNKENAENGFPIYAYVTEKNLPNETVSLNERMRAVKNLKKVLPEGSNQNESEQTHTQSKIPKLR